MGTQKCSSLFLLIETTLKDHPSFSAPCSIKPMSQVQLHCSCVWACFLIPKKCCSKSNLFLHGNLYLTVHLRENATHNINQIIQFLNEQQKHNYHSVIYMLNISLNLFIPWIHLTTFLSIFYRPCTIPSAGYIFKNQAQVLVTLMKK